MQITRVVIENFRGHTRTDIPLTQLGCLIGENNAGKSSVLHAIQFALEDRKLSSSDFQDAAKAVTVMIEIAEISERDLARVGDSHREKVASMIRDKGLTIIRSQSFDGKPEAKYRRMVPSDDQFSIDALNVATKGKSGVQLRAAAVALRPELDSLLDANVLKADVLREWVALNDGLPLDQLREQLDPYPTGISTAIKPLFPSIIYIESVKDAESEAKASGTSAFAKLLSILFAEVSAQFEDIEKQFNAVHRRLSRHTDASGEQRDERLWAVQHLESVIDRFVNAGFPGVKVKMNIPAPTLAMLLSATDLLVDDGHESGLSTKGDGLKRNMLFALLRAYVDIREKGIPKPNIEGVGPSEHSPDEPNGSVSGGVVGAYLLLFEEPELYLHPRAQRQLMAALGEFAKVHQVLVTTHSPGFFQPGTKGFTRLYKDSAVVTAKPVDLTLGLRDAYQVVRHENNEAAFFARRVVLVEGDSDTFVYPHLARIISSAWDDIEKNIMFVKIDGKGNIRRYRQFFESFEVPIHVITDLDALSNGFDHLTATESIKASRGDLMTLVNKQLSSPSAPKAKKVKEILRRTNARDLWQSAQVHLAEWARNKSSDAADSLMSDLTQLFDQGNGDAVLAHLLDPPTEEIARLTEDVISSLAEENVYVLRRGDLEAYCQTSGNDKVTTAIKFCEDTTSLDSLKKVHGGEAEEIVTELTGIFGRIFG